MLICIFVCVLFAAITAKSMAKDGELEVKLQFLEYELEDLCILKNEAEWKFLNGTVPDLKKVGVFFFGLNKKIEMIEKLNECGSTSKTF